ncbi:MAG TPA: transglycosylase SLT domain-containing protein [Chitinophagales bacterium]|nr:transglycosylase SLT domain-containing protein [Chitinophagales bacterium]
MRIQVFRTIAVLLFFTAFTRPVFSKSVSTAADSMCIDPIICQLDSMALNMFTRDKFFVSDEELLASINMPYDFIPKYTEAEIREKLKLVPAIVPLNYNQYVKSFIDLFAYRKRGLMSRCLANSQIYFPIFEEILDRKGVPVEFKYLPIVESAFNPIAVSRAGATGLWQFMYGTGQMMGLDINSYIDERRDPIKSTEAAADYLNKLYSIYGDWHLVLAAYNSGPGNVNKAIARAGGVKNFWAIMNYLPAETRSYVPTFIAAVYVMENYKDYKLVSSEPKRELYAVDTVLITAKVSLKHISNILGIAEDELQFLNPSIKVGVIPYTQNGFALNLPINYFAMFEARKEEIMNDPNLLVPTIEPVAVASSTKTIYYKVKKNESIAKVASKHGVSVSSIKKWNRLKSTALYTGQKLKLVVSAPSTAVSSNYAQAFSNKIIEKPIAVAATDSIKPDVATTDTNISTASAASDTNTASAQAPLNIGLDKNCNCIFHVVQPGDTLWGLTQRYQGLTVDKLKADNKALKDRPIKVGDIIKIFL